LAHAIAFTHRDTFVDRDASSIRTTETPIAHNQIVVVSSLIGPQSQIFFDRVSSIKTLAI
jgi:hypothetical protein